MFNQNYYQAKKQELINKSSRNLQRLANAAIDFAMENQDIEERLKELEEQVAQFQIEQAEVEAKQKQEIKKQEEEKLSDGKSK
jgi:uncharacterized protein (DUF342 family)